MVFCILLRTFCCKNCYYYGALPRIQVVGKYDFHHSRIKVLYIFDNASFKAKLKTELAFLSQNFLPKNQKNGTKPLQF